MRPLSIGKARGLQQCSSADGKIAVLALDHRNNLCRLLHPENAEATTAAEISQFKRQVIAALGEIPSAYLLDPLFGAVQSIASLTLPGACGLLVAVEQTGYVGDPAARKSNILPGWSVEQIKRMGATGVKLLVYYHPEAKTSADIEKLVENTAADCARSDIPLFLEILTYSLDPEKKRLTGKERRDVVITSAERLTLPGVDVLKAEFPLDIEASPDISNWESACADLTKASQVPWVLLSASVDFEVFKRQIVTACLAGACGVAVGRAVWKEAVGMPVQERMDFLNTTAKTRMREVCELVNALGKTWTSYFTINETDENWYKDY